MYKLVGHRGYPAKFPENTLLGLQAAIEAGAAAVEFDVQCSVDGTPYVFHDENTLRLTGQDHIIYECTDQELSQFRASYPERFAEQYQDVPVSPLADVIEMLLDYPDVEVFIEPKSHSLEHFGVSKLMDRILETSHALGQRRRMISFHDQALAYARQNGCPVINWVISDFSEETATRARELKPDMLCADIRILPEALPAWIDAQWMIYPMDDPALLKHYADMGVHYIETDDIGQMIL